MTGGLFSNAKMTLVFAGGVIGAAVLFAGVFAPTIIERADVERAGAQAAAPGGPPRQSAPEQKPAPAVPPADPVDDPVDDKAFFGDFVGFSDDAELIDDTAGFDPSPPGKDSLVLAPEAKALDDGDPAPRSDGDEGDRRRPARPALRSPEESLLRPVR